MILDNEIILVSDGTQNSIPLTSETEIHNQEESIFLISLEVLNDGHIKETWFEDSSNIEVLDSQTKISRLQSFIIKPKSMARRSIKFISSVGAVVKVRVIKITEALQNVIADNSCEICKKLIAAVLRHALAAVGIPTLGELEEELALDFAELVISTVDLIFNSLGITPNYVHNIFEHLQKIIKETVQSVANLQERCTSAVCKTLNHC